MSSGQKRLEDVEFIFSECVRLNNIAASGPRNIPKSDVWHSLPHPSGGGMMICGQAANDRLEALAKYAGLQAKILGRLKLKTLRDAVATILTKRFLVEKRDLNIAQVDRALSSAAREAAKTCVDVVHWIPCHLMLSKDPDEIKIGPVTFRNRAAFRGMLLEKVRSYRASMEPGESRWDRRLLQEAIAYYRSFQWVAEVSIGRCDDEVSRKLAERGVTSALDCLHLLLGAQWTDRMRVGGPAVTRDKRANLSIAADGSLNVSTSYRGAGQVNFSDGWSSRLAEEDFRYFLSLFGAALEAAINPDFVRPLSRRFLDAAQWFGEASRDESHATATVKYVTAIERMVMTQEKDDITKIVSERASAICFAADSEEEREYWRRRALEVYDIRSKLVHGAVSPLTSEARTGAFLGAQIGETVILQTLSAWGEEQIRKDDVSVKKLAAWFDDICLWADRLSPSPA